MRDLPIHNVHASTGNLARGWLQSLDLKSAETRIPTATLELLLKTVIELTYQGMVDMSDTMQRTVAGQIAQVSAAERERNG